MAREPSDFMNVQKRSIQRQEKCIRFLNFFASFKFYDHFLEILSIVRKKCFLFQLLDFITLERVKIEKTDIMENRAKNVSYVCNARICEFLRYSVSNSAQYVGAAKCWIKF